jgi:predicted nucleic acid-binding protein
MSVSAFLDSSVLVATFYGDHEHHDASFALFQQHEKSNAATAAHCLAEVYSVATGMPGKDRAGPDEVLLFLNDVRERLTLVALDDGEYFKVLEDAAAAGVSGGTTYDALIARCAMKVDSQTIYTWNVKHFKRLGADIAARVREPP